MSSGLSSFIDLFFISVNWMFRAKATVVIKISGSQVLYVDELFMSLERMSACNQVIHYKMINGMYLLDVLG